MYQAVLIILLPIQCVPSITLTYYYGDGSYFTGSVDGEGRPSDGVFYSSKNTMTYNGSYVSGLYHGNGSWYGEGGEEYHGQFRRGEASGRGVWTNGNTGERVEGEFENGTVNGEGVLYRAGERVRLEGVFKRGHAHGPATVYWGDTGER